MPSLLAFRHGWGKLARVRFLRLQANELNRYPLAILAGLLLAIAFPKLHIAGMAWIAPGLMISTALGIRGAAAFRIGYVAGLAHFLASLYWLLLIPVTIAPIVGWLALSGFLALFPGAWVWLCWKIFPSTAAANSGSAGMAAVNSGSAITLRAAFDEFVATTWLQRVGWGFCCAALWVAWEMIQARIFSGFPWNFLGASQYQLLPLIQIAAFTGVYGISFLLAWFSVSLFAAGVGLIRRTRSAWSWGREFAMPLLAIIVVLGFGFHRVLTTPPAGPRLKVLMVQPSIPQTMIWDSKESAARFAQLLELTERGLTNKPDLLLWPEAAVPSLFRWETNAVYKGQSVYEAITNLVQRHKVWLIMGADDAVPRADAPEGADFYNSSFLVSPEGRLVSTYRKQNLVIFGEYVPFSHWFPWLMRFAHVEGEFARGKGAVTFSIPDLRLKTSVLICFEDVFPQLARRHVQADTDFLLNLTNDGWFREGAAQWQHAATASFRAVENGRPLVRVTNNGLTCWIDAHGGFHDVDYPGFQNIYQAGFKVGYIPMLGDQKGAVTFYNRHGDWFGWGCVALAGCAVLWAVASRLISRSSNAVTNAPQ